AAGRDNAGGGRDAGTCNRPDFGRERLRRAWPGARRRRERPGLGSRGVLEAAFWICVAGALYSYLLYPALLLLAGRNGARGEEEGGPDPGAEWPSLSIVIAARNEEARLAGKLEDL